MLLFENFEYIFSNEFQPKYPVDLRYILITSIFNVSVPKQRKISL